MYQDLSGMYRRHPVSRIWHAIRHKPFARNTLYGTVVIMALYVLYNMMTPRDAIMGFLPGVKEPVDVPPDVWEERAEQVRRAFIHAYHGYERYAAPSDELKPKSNGKVDNFNGWGVTVFDSLDTMLLMDLQDEFQRALPMVQRANFSRSTQTYVPFFETIIRYLGGLLSAYAMSKEQILLDRADELAQVLDPVFNSSSGLAYFGINPTNGRLSGPKLGILAEFATLQMEYIYLAKLTGRKEHYARADTVMKAISRPRLLKLTGGMLPILWNLTSGVPFDNHLSVGSQADSTHEYLLKQYLMTAKKDKTSLEMYIRATNHIITNLLYLSPTRNLLYVTDTKGSTMKTRAIPSHIFEHLSCFLPGLLALGAHTLPLNDLASLGIDVDSLEDVGFGDAARGHKLTTHYDLKQLHMWAAEGLAQTCWLTYADQPTGLGPDEMMMRQWDSRDTKATGVMSSYGGYLWIEALERWKGSGSRGVPPGVGEKKPIVYTEKERLTGRGKGRDYHSRKPGYLLRPETLESLYLIWRITGDWKWRVRGWQIFEAIERHTKTKSGYASLKTVEFVPAPKVDSMPSYFMAETLKYLYLMFKEEDLVPLDKWVFNTEAHPLPVFEWSEKEKTLFDIEF